VLKAGYSLSVMGNRRREPVERLVGLGATECTSPADVAVNSDIVILCVTTSDAVEELVFGSEGLLKGANPGLLLIDCGTSSPDSTQRISEALQKIDCSMMDVPLGKSAAAAESGTLNMMAGGSARDFERAKPLLDTMSENLFHLGPVGTGHKIKLINNAFSMSVAVLIAELVNAARATDVDLQLLFDVMSSGPLNSQFFEWNMEASLTGDESKLQFSLQNGLKDIGYFVDMLRQQGIEPNVPAAAQAKLEQAVSDGHGEDFVGSLARHLA
ncbi:MAG: NAD(P)-dependent oxidoreductase, partial [Gammaproteobacteria bacterium]|nr:NAD(P)-dependent oxidoreductase [Gammaproteobacteria bacterium]